MDLERPCPLPPVLEHGGEGERDEALVPEMTVEALELDAPGDAGAKPQEGGGSIGEGPPARAEGGEVDGDAKQMSPTAKLFKDKAQTVKTMAMSVDALVEERDDDLSNALVSAAYNVASAQTVAAALARRVAASPKKLSAKQNSKLLGYAARADNVDAIASLARAGTNLEMTNRRGRTPLMVAASCGSTGVVQALLDRGADWRREDPEGKTAFDMARGANHKTALLLRDWGAKSGTDQDRIDHATGLLWEASCRGDAAEVARLLAEGKAEIDGTQRMGQKRADSSQSSLFVAAWNNHVAVMKLLLAAKADIELTTVTQWTPLMAAAHNGHADASKILLDSGADWRKLSRSKKNALDYAQESGHVVRCLLHAYDVPACHCACPIATVPGCLCTCLPSRLCSSVPA